MVERKVAVLRADASDLIGVGHVMRSLALGEALLDAAFDVVLASVDLPAGMREEARKCGITVVDLQCEPFGSDDAIATLALNGAVLVIDGYLFEREFFEILENRATNFAVIDDNVETKALAPSVVINQNPHATAEMYAHLSASPKLLLGLQYALLRREVREATKQSIIPVAGKVFVAMGGSDFLQLTSPIVDGLKDLDIEICVAIGPTNSQRQQIEETVRSIPRARVILQADYITELASSSLAILAAGSSLWEAAALGVPSIGLIVADNQIGASIGAEHCGISISLDVRNGLHNESIVSNVENLLTMTSGALAKMVTATRSEVDEFGSMRVLQVIGPNS
ncbi:MAG: UDP-2,4-diacetamido-2,4,6-trideoxy-beta-L-altropyranose hydrolase [Actinobacteria bacterium]|nr:UDP-2,4-diacetamido-2,4,6-trideoxy-beta-L-altropyranose hydrolase [Actinomycetota bacterium]